MPLSLGDLRLAGSFAARRIDQITRQSQAQAQSPSSAAALVPWRPFRAAAQHDARCGCCSSLTERAIAVKEAEAAAAEQQQEASEAAAVSVAAAPPWRPWRIPSHQRVARPRRLTRDLTSSGGGGGASGGVGGTEVATTLLTPLPPLPSPCRWR